MLVGDVAVEKYQEKHRLY